jgi:predicted Fe-Mo cluster-binding NifX family protein
MVLRIALTISADTDDAPLSPFFSLAPWVMVIDTSGGEPLMLRNCQYNADHVVDLICRNLSELAICGHIPAEAAQRMAEAGIEARIGPCSVPAMSLIDRAHILPRPPRCPLRPRPAS